MTKRIIAGVLTALFSLTVLGVGAAEAKPTSNWEKSRTSNWE